jgi:hypothetical protein
VSSGPTFRHGATGDRDYVQHRKIARYTRCGERCGINRGKGSMKDGSAGRKGVRGPLRLATAPTLVRQRSRAGSGGSRKADPRGFAGSRLPANAGAGYQYPARPCRHVHHPSTPAAPSSGRYPARMVPQPRSSGRYKHPIMVRILRPLRSGRSACAMLASEHQERPAAEAIRSTTENTCRRMSMDGAGAPGAAPAGAAARS